VRETANISKWESVCEDRNQSIEGVRGEKQQQCEVPCEARAHALETKSGAAFVNFRSKEILSY
jgi:hypothetical protein